MSFVVIFGTRVVPIEQQWPTRAFFVRTRFAILPVLRVHGSWSACKALRSACQTRFPRFRPLTQQVLYAQIHLLSKKRYIRYDTIRDAILTCARKPTWVGLIYRTETATKNCKTEKLKSKSRYVRSNSKCLGNHVVSSEEEKERLQWEGFAEKEEKILSLEWKREWAMKN